MRKPKQLKLIVFIGLVCSLTFGQTLPSIPQPASFENYGSQNWTNSQRNVPKISSPTNIPSAAYEQERINRQNEQLMQEVELNEQRRIEAQHQLYAELTEQTNLELPSKSAIAGTHYYRNAFDKLLAMNADNFSIKEATFLVENAFYEGKKDYGEFNKVIKQTGNFLRAKMNELGYNPNSNPAKNGMLFQFFSDTLKIKDKKFKHLPFQYDFEDYMGKSDWTKMFVHKLLETGKGQCNSLPRLYLILAEEMGAEAFLSLSPNHSYIKFRDEHENWYNLELTNGMFMTDSFILQSGYIKSEALQSGIYMQTLLSRQLMAQLLTDFAMGYIRKFGYDLFVKQVIDSALERSPYLINAHMVNANFLAVQFEYAAQQVGINPRDGRDLQNIRYYPPIIAMLNAANAQYQKIDNLGYAYMPAQAYESWLNSLMEAKQRQNNEAMKQQFNLKLKQLKN